MPSDPSTSCAIRPTIPRTIRLRTRPYLPLSNLSTYMVVNIRYCETLHSLQGVVKRYGRGFFGIFLAGLLGRFLWFWMARQVASWRPRALGVLPHSVVYRTVVGSFGESWSGLFTSAPSGAGTGPSRSGSRVSC